MKNLLQITLLLSALFLKAQDTIYFRNNSIVSAKIIEVGISEVTYKRFDNPEGPFYLNSKSEIAKIKYANGVTDTMTYISSKATSTQSDAVSHKNELRVMGTELYYGSQVLGQLRSHTLLKDRSLSRNQVSAIKEAAGIKHRQQGYNALGTGLFVTGFAIPAVVTINTFSDRVYANNMAVNTIVAGAITGALFRIAGHVIVKINKNKSNARKLAFLRKYNQNEIIY